MDDTERNQGKPVIVCGDLNVCHKSYDVYDPKQKMEDVPGFTPEEKKSFQVHLKNYDLVDTFREIYPKKKLFTFWHGMQQKSRTDNKGWRLDYFLIRKKWMKNVMD